MRFEKQHNERRSGKRQVLAVTHIEWSQWREIAHCNGAP
jgi:hypothetical protein